MRLNEIRHCFEREMKGFAKSAELCNDPEQLELIKKTIILLLNNYRLLYVSKSKVLKKTMEFYEWSGTLADEVLDIINNI